MAHLYEEYTSKMSIYLTRVPRVGKINILITTQVIRINMVHLKNENEMQKTLIKAILSNYTNVNSKIN